MLHVVTSAVFFSRLILPRRSGGGYLPLIDLLSGPRIGPRVRSRVDAGFHGYAWSAGVKGPRLNYSEIKARWCAIIVTRRPPSPLLPQAAFRQMLSRVPIVPLWRDRKIVSMMRSPWIEIRPTEMEHRRMSRYYDNYTGCIIFSRRNYVIFLYALSI